MISELLLVTGANFGNVGLPLFIARATYFVSYDLARHFFVAGAKNDIRLSEQNACAKRVAD